jgi:hypothetical protein
VNDKFEIGKDFPQALRLFDAIHLRRVGTDFQVVLIAGFPNFKAPSARSLRFFCPRLEEFVATGANFF